MLCEKLFSFLVFPLFPKKLFDDFYIFSFSLFEFDIVINEGGIFYCELLIGYDRLVALDEHLFCHLEIKSLRSPTKVGQSVTSTLLRRSAQQSAAAGVCLKTLFSPSSTLNYKPCDSLFYCDKQKEILPTIPSRRSAATSIGCHHRRRCLAGYPLADVY